MIKNCKKIFLLIFSIGFVCINNISANASTISSSIEERDINASITIQSSFLDITKRGTTMIIDVILQSNGVGNLSSNVTVQRLNNGSWQNVRSWSYSRNSSCYLENSFTYTGLSNNVYRIVTKHCAIVNGISDTKTYYSNSITVK